MIKQGVQKHPLGVHRLKSALIILDKKDREITLYLQNFWVLKIKVAI